MKKLFVSLMLVALVVPMVFVLSACSRNDSIVVNNLRFDQPYLRWEIPTNAPDTVEFVVYMAGNRSDYRVTRENFMIMTNHVTGFHLMPGDYRVMVRVRNYETGTTWRHVGINLTFL